MARNKVSQWLIAKSLKGLIWSLNRLPWRTRLETTGWIMRRVLGPLTGYRKRCLTNLRYVWPDLSEAEMERIADGVLDNFGRTTIENFATDEFLARDPEAQLTGPGVAAFEEALATGRPVMFGSGHFGNHEAFRRIMVRKGRPITGIYKPLSNVYFNDYYEDQLRAYAPRIFPATRDGTKEFIEYLADGNIGILLVDVAGKKYPRLPFLGKPAHTSIASGSIALKVGALYLPYFTTRNADGLTFTVTIGEPIEQTTAEEMTLGIVRACEEQIKATPEQWFWVHRRWKPDT